MGRLRGRELPSRIGKPTSRLQRKDADEADRHRRRDAELPWRSWQKTARWQKLRDRILARDGLVCQQTGVMLLGKHPAPNSPVVDHKLPHRGDPDLFWDETNLQTVSKAWHDREKQKREHAAGL
ncbi:HNH endonuclease [Aestuariibius sp. 2305UL40-4]|uniref:HNH endonuclease n=1 Tax=Aestuariibius violaceus TaxID=3234132 RepID=UPI00345F10E7